MGKSAEQDLTIYKSKNETEVVIAGQMMGRWRAYWTLSTRGYSDKPIFGRPWGAQDNEQRRVFRDGDGRIVSHATLEELKAAVVALLEEHDYLPPTWDA